MLEVNRKKIKCLIFSAREKVIQQLSHDIWQGDLTSGEIMNRARSLWSEADSLANCSKCNRSRFECKICKTIAELRKRTASYMLGPNLKKPVQFH